MEVDGGELLLRRLRPAIRSKHRVPMRVSQDRPLLSENSSSAVKAPECINFPRAPFCRKRSGCMLPPELLQGSEALVRNLCRQGVGAACPAFLCRQELARETLRAD